MIQAVSNTILRPLFFFWLVLASSHCNSLFYYPDSNKYANPSKLGYPYEEVYFYSQDLTRLNGYFFPAKNSPKGTILQVHGNAQNISSHFYSLVWVTKRGYNLLCFDYRGYGDSEKKEITREGLRLDALAAMQWAAQIPKKQRGPLFIVHGQSLGGVILMEALAHYKERVPKEIDRVILESTFYSYQSIAREKLADTWVTWPFQWLAFLLISDSGAPEKNLSKLDAWPKLVLHGKKDRIIPVHIGEELYEMLPPPKEKRIVPNARHIENLSRRFPEVREAYLRFLQGQTGS